MKKVLFTILGGVLMIGCKEKAPSINLEKKAVEDSAYTLTAIPATDPHYVLVEEFTGQTCSNCPNAHEELEEIREANGHKVIVLGLYKFGVGQAVPAHDAEYDFRDSSASSIGDLVYNGVNQLPNAGIDRLPVSGSLKIDQGAWVSTIASRLAIEDSLNLKIVSSYNSVTNEATITANVIYTKPVATPQNLSIVIVEDSLVDKQDFPFGSAYPHDVNPAYVFTNVFRGMVTSVPFGDPVLSSAAVKTAGMGLQRRFIYKLKSNIVNPSRCRVVAFVSNAVAGNSVIAQAAETKLKP